MQLYIQVRAACYYVPQLTNSLRPVIPEIRPIPVKSGVGSLLAMHHLVQLFDHDGRFFQDCPMISWAF